MPLAAQDPWARVPAFPTSCYDTETPAFVDKLSNIRQEVYERLCAKWLRAESSPLLKYLSDLKAFQVSEQIPGEFERERHLKREFDLYGVAHATLKSTATQAVIDYMTAMMTVFRRRDTETLTARSR